MLNIKDDSLYIDNCSVVDLAQEYGTPLFVYSEHKLLEQINKLKAAFTDKYPNTHIAYAAKAFCTKYMCRLLDNEGLWLDVVSQGELYTALVAGFPAERIEFNGNNKSEEEIRFALQNKIGKIIVDNISELEELERIAQNLSVKPQILFRINPEIESDTHDYINTGKKGSKFGIPMDRIILDYAVKYALESTNIELMGFHFHVGSQLFNPSSHLQALNVGLELMEEYRVKTGACFRELNVGGGFGVAYSEDDSPTVIDDYLDPIMKKIIDFCSRHDYPMPRVSIEPGRYIVAEAGIELYTIGNTKSIPNVKEYASIDGGMSDNMRVGLYGAKYKAVIANKAEQSLNYIYDISGKCCESTDILIKELRSPKLEKGDILAVTTTGAYGYSMANNYNKLLIPAVVVVKGDKHEVIVKRQTIHQMIENEI